MEDELQKNRRPVKNLAVVQMAKAALQACFQVQGRPELLQDDQSGERGKSLVFKL